MKLLIATDSEFWKADIGSKKRISRLCSYLTGTRETLVPAMAEKIALLDQEAIEALVNYYASYSP